MPHVVAAFFYLNLVSLEWLAQADIKRAARAKRGRADADPGAVAQFVRLVEQVDDGKPAVHPAELRYVKSVRRPEIHREVRLQVAAVRVAAVRRESQSRAENRIRA